MVNTIKLHWIEWFGVLICASVLVADALHSSGGGERNLLLVTVLLISGSLIALTGTIIRNRKLKNMGKTQSSFLNLRQKYIVMLVTYPWLIFYLTNLYFVQSILVAVAIILVIMLVVYFKNNRIKNKEYQSS